MNWPNLCISVRRKSMSTKYEIEGEVINCTLEALYASFI